MSRFVVNISWADVPHLSKEQCDKMEAAILPHQRDARIRGIPVLGAGAIYQVAESAITVDPFDIPKHWPRFYALDVGWNRTAALWFALDRESDTLYVYSEHYVAHEKPPVHAAAIKARGDWMLGVIDPASHGRSATDGQQLYSMYTELGLKLINADNTVESGIYNVWSRMSRGGLKVFSTCRNFFYEYRLYRRDEKGKVVKKDDHLMDCVRYGCVTGVDIATPMPGQFGNRKSGRVNHQTEWSMFDTLAKEVGTG